MSFFERLKEKWSGKTDRATEKFREGLAKTRQNFSSKVNDLLARYRKVDEDFFMELEEILIAADVGFDTTLELVDELKMEVKRRKIQEPEMMREVIVEK